MKAKLLFVDDEENILQSLKRALFQQRQIWELSFADCVDSAVKKCQTENFDVIISDISMPGKDGFDLLRKLHNDNKTKDIPFIVLTGKSDIEIKKRALLMGATDILHKPFDNLELMARLQNSIRLKSHIDKIVKNACNLEKAVKEKTEELSKSHLDMILRLSNLSEIRDRTMGNHGVRVACYARLIAENLGLSQNFIEKLFLSSPLHDIGKTFIPQKILKKTGVLSFEEWEGLREHCILGHQILNKKIDGISAFFSFKGNKYQNHYDPNLNPFLKTASEIALNHHEWWNGKGYPNKKMGDEIPLEARIVSIADCYDELTFDQPYQPAISDTEALKLIRENIGTQFDPEVSIGFEKGIKKITSFKNQFFSKEKSINQPCEK
jgi:putative two-component system response regulator